VRAQMTAPSTLHIVESGDHSLRVTKSWLKSEGLDQAAVDDRTLEVIRAFLSAP